MTERFQASSVAGFRRGKLWYGKPNVIHNAIGHAKLYSRSYNAVIRVYDEAGNVIRDTSRMASE
jgi:hypothetical protein